MVKVQEWVVPTFRSALAVIVEMLRDNGGEGLLTIQCKAEWARLRLEKTISLLTPHQGPRRYNTKIK